MKNASIIGIVLVAMALAGCDKAAAPTDSAQPAAPPAEIVAPAAPEIALDKIETRLEKAAFGSIDGIDKVSAPQPGTVTEVSGEKFEVAGFAIDEVAATAAAGVIVLVDGTPYVAVYGGDRPDIAAALNNPNYVKSQFWVEIPTAGMAKGLHDLSFRVVAADRSGYYESDWKGQVSIQ